MSSEISTESLSSIPYKPLTEPDSIRVLLLQPTPHLSDMIVCSLEYGTLRHYHQDLIDPFIALSYVWGDKEDTRTIIIDEKRVSITANLDSALRHVRDSQRIIRVWADAFSINQDDALEKNQQVRQMDNIYLFARHTIIFLGEPEDTDAGMNKILDETNTLAIYRYLAAKGETPENTSAPHASDLVAKARYFLSSVLEKPWFTRIWVLQELVLSKDPWVQFGEARIRWDDFMNFVSILPKLSSVQEMDPFAYTMVSKMDKIRGNFQALRHVEDQERRKSLRLFTLVTTRRGLGASNNLDFIYAHLGITTALSGSRDSFEIDYSKPVVQVFAEFAYYCLVKEKQNILHHIEDRETLMRLPGLPSWAPDWSLTHAHPTPRLENPRLFGLWRARNFQHATPTFNRNSDGSIRLSAMGWKIGRVYQVGHPLQFMADQKDNDSWSLSDFSALEESLKLLKNHLEILAPTKQVSSIYCAHVRNWVKFIGLKLNPNNDTAWNSKLEPSIDQPIPSNRTIPSIDSYAESQLRFLYTRLCQLPAKFHPMAFISLAHMGWFGYSYDDTKIGTSEHYYELVSEMSGKCFCALKFSNEEFINEEFEWGDQIFLVPRSTKAGDSIVFLEGFNTNMPVVLRQQTHGADNSHPGLSENQYIVVGRCYFRGSSVNWLLNREVRRESEMMKSYTLV